MLNDGDRISGLKKIIGTELTTQLRSSVRRLVRTAQIKQKI